MSKKGVPIEGVGGAAHACGLKAGDSLVSINNMPVRDLIDYLFYRDDENHIEYVSGGRLKRTEVLGDPGLELEHFRTRVCSNKCVFCFVSQLPRGLRRTLYIKDEDYRLSFLYGNYVTLTNLSQEDKKRIIEQRLSPLYVSVHATDDRIRRALLGNPKASPIIKELRFLARHRIVVHTQVILCPGINDGRVLEKTITDLHGLSPHVESAAVVPVGLTEHRRVPMRPVGKQDAGKALALINRLRKRFMKHDGAPFVHASDELYIKAGEKFPGLEEYGDLSQIENGVGMVPLFLREAARLRFGEIKRGKRYLTFTGVSFYPYLKKFVDRLARKGADVLLVPVTNRFLGESVTVTGLLTGRDIVAQLSGHARGRDVLLIPDCVLRAEGDLLLDDSTPMEIERTLGIKTAVIEPTPLGLLKGVSNENKR